MAKSRIAVRDMMTARSSRGRPSWEKRMTMLAVMPPGTGGDAVARITHMITAVTIQDTDTSTCRFAATLTAAVKKSTTTPGL